MEKRGFHFGPPRRAVVPAERRHQKASPWRPAAARWHYGWRVPLDPIHCPISRVARFGLFEAKTQIWPYLKFGWPPNF